MGIKLNISGYQGYKILTYPNLSDQNFHMFSILDTYPKNNIRYFYVAHIYLCFHPLRLLYELIYPIQNHLA